MEPATADAMVLARARSETSMIVPSFDRDEFDEDSATESGFSPVYANVVDKTLSDGVSVAPASRVVPSSRKGTGSNPESEITEISDADDLEDLDETGPDEDGAPGAIEAAMCASYLRANYVEALGFALRLLDLQPRHGVAQLIAESCAGDDSD
jgi:hypothetical protein